MADIAEVFGWMPSAMSDWSIEELMLWRDKAMQRRVKPVGFLADE